MKNPGPDITSSKKPILISSFEPMWKLCHLASSSLPLHCKPFLDTNCCKLSLDPPQAQPSLIHDKPSIKNASERKWTFKCLEWTEGKSAFSTLPPHLVVVRGAGGGDEGTCFWEPCHALVLIRFCAQTPLPFMVRQVSYPSGINTRRWDGVWNKNNHVDITCM